MYCCYDNTKTTNWLQLFTALAVASRTSHRAIHGQLVTAQDKQLTLEASLMAKTEEMSKLRRTMAKEQERNRAILEALEAEKAEMDEIRK
eukprot:jgi/Tetstr1/449001/TSEL_036226.t1